MRKRPWLLAAFLLFASLFINIPFDLCLVVGLFLYTCVMYSVPPSVPEKRQSHPLVITYVRADLFGALLVVLLIPTNPHFIFFFFFAPCHGHHRHHGDHSYQWHSWPCTSCSPICSSLDLVINDVIYLRSFTIAICSNVFTWQIGRGVEAYLSFL
jgi:hypothetical protein